MPLPSVPSMSAALRAHALRGLTLACVCLVAIRADAQALAAPDAEDSVPQLTSIERARVAIEDADFAAAELALDEAVHAGLTPAELLQWLEVSAMLAFADGRLGAMEDFLLGWASIAPAETPIPSALPSALRTRLAELRADVQLHLSAEPLQSIEGATRRIALPVQVPSDPGHLIREVEVQIAINGAPFEALRQGEAVEVVGDPHQNAQVAYFVRALGPGGALIGTLGSEVSPVEALLTGLPPSTEGLTIGLVITGAAVLVGIASVLAWGLIEDWGRSNTSTLTGPSVAVRF